MKKAKKDILFVVDERRMGGVSILLEDILKMINTGKYNIDILVLHNNGEMLKNIPSNVNLIYGTSYFNAIDYTYKELLKMKNIILLYKKAKIIFDMKTGYIEKRIKRERKKILKKTYDVEIAFKDGFTALFTIFGNSNKKVHWLHYEYKKTNPNGKYNKLYQRILPKFDQVIAVSEGVKKAFNDIYRLNDKVEIIYNLIDTDRIITKAKEPNENKFKKEDLNLISVGRLHPMKGYDRLIRVVKRLKDVALLPDNFKLRIYGNGIMYSELDTMVKEYNLNNHVFMMGQAMNPYKYLKDSDLFILSSQYEPFGLVMIEAMTLKVPVLATENAATDFIIRNKVNGYITDNSETGLYEGLKYLLENQNEIVKYKKALVNYSYDNTKIIQQIEGVLD